MKKLFRVHYQRCAELIILAENKQEARSMADAAIEEALECSDAGVEPDWLMLGVDALTASTQLSTEEKQALPYGNRDDNPKELTALEIMRICEEEEDKEKQQHG